MVYLLDPNSGTAMSVDHQYLAQAIYERYPGFRLCQIPASERDPDEKYPFGLKHEESGMIVKRFREDEMNIRTIFEWLYLNDSAIHGERKLYEQMIAAQKKAEEDALAVSKAELAENLSFVNWAATRAPHTLKVSDQANAMLLKR